MSKTYDGSGKDLIRDCPQSQLDILAPKRIQDEQVLSGKNILILSTAPFLLLFPYAVIPDIGQPRLADGRL